MGLLTPFEDPTLTDEDGRLVVRNLPAGVYLVSAFLRGHVGDRARIRVLDGEISRGAIVLLPIGSGR